MARRDVGVQRIDASRETAAALEAGLFEQDDGKVGVLFRERQRRKTPRRAAADDQDVGTLLDGFQWYHLKGTFRPGPL